MRLLLNLFFSIIISLIKPFRIPREGIVNYFVRLNNQLVISNGIKIAQPKLLILIPHCLQNIDCDFKITHNIKNCRGCGKCSIKRLIEISDQYKVPISVATGGGLARRLIKQHQPDAIIAVACEQELFSGICDVYPVPVLAVENLRPQGPCQNTDVNLDSVCKAIDSLLVK